MNLVQLCGALNAFIGNEDAQEEITRVRNHEELCKKLKFLKNVTSSKKGQALRINTQTFLEQC